MRFLLSVSISFLLLWGWTTSLSSKEVKDTLLSYSNDKVFVKYNIAENEGKVTISFTEVRKQLGRKYQDIYDTPQKLERIKVLFFEKGGPYKEDFTSDLSTAPMIVPSDEIRYHLSDEGYVWLDNSAELSLELITGQSTLSLPVYLAYYEGKHRYKVFAKCGNLNISLKRGKAQSGQPGKTTELVVKEKQITKTEEVEVSEDITPAQEADLLINNVRETLGQSDLSVSELETLGRRIDRLRDLEILVPDKALQARIQNVLQMYDARKRAAEIEQDDNRKKEGEEAQRQAEEKQAKEDLAYVQERLANVKDLSESDVAELKSSANDLRRKAHSIDNKELAKQMKDTADNCDKEIKKIDDAKKRRNIWMIIGGILLAILMFIGNIFFQQFRQMRNIKSMQDAQDKIAKRAENEARRRAQSLARSKISRVQGQVRQKSRDAVRNGVKSGVNNVKKGIGKNNKGLSI